MTESATTVNAPPTWYSELAKAVTHRDSALKAIAKWNKKLEEAEQIIEQLAKEHSVQA